MKPKGLEERVNRSISGLKETDSEGFKETNENVIGSLTKGNLWYVVAQTLAT